jgi:hypothetical protein
MAHPAHSPAGKGCCRAKGARREAADRSLDARPFLSHSGTATAAATLTLPLRRIHVHIQAWLDREATVTDDEGWIWFQGDYVKELIEMTDYPTFDVEVRVCAQRDGNVRGSAAQCARCDSTVCAVRQKLCAMRCAGPCTHCRHACCIARCFAMRSRRAQAVNKTFMEWEHHKHENIMTFRDHAYRSVMTGNMSPVHHTPWKDALEDTCESYVGAPYVGNEKVAE